MQIQFRKKTIIKAYRIISKGKELDDSYRNYNFGNSRPQNCGENGVEYRFHQL